MAGPTPAIFSVGSAVLRLQTILLDHGAPSERHLAAAAGLLSRPDYSDVVTERKISSLCGFPLCPNPLSKPSSQKKTHQARYHISLSEHKVYDLEERNKFCSEKCLVESKAYELSLSEKRTFDLSPDKIDGILKLFEEGANEKLGLGLGFEKDLGKKKEVKIVEKEGGVNGETNFDEWIGSARAIEGYEPKFDWNKGSRNGMTHQQESDFRSEIFFDDGFDVTKDISDEISKKIENVIINEKKNPKKKNKETSNKAYDWNKGSKNGMTHTHQQETDFKSEIFFDDGFDCNKGSKNRMTYQQKMDFRSEIFFDDGFDGQTKDISDEISKTLENVIINEQRNPKNKNQFSPKPAKNEKKITNTDLKSSLKKNNGSSATLKSQRSVKWADNEEKSTVEKSKSKGEESVRIESAEACVEALIRASEAVVSGDSTVDQAVSEAGIVILPQENHKNEKEYSDEKTEHSDKGKECSDEKTEHSDKEKEYSDEKIEYSDKGKEYSLESESESEITKWPKKPVLLETDAFDNEDSWHDSPPDGFSLTLSPFATIYMSIFEWVTRSSLMFIYGRKMDQNEEFSEVNLRKYPCKVVVSDGQSAEIRKALDFFLSHSLSALVSDLRITVPVSTLEKNMGFLIDTMSFVEALPSLKAKQWRVIILLFLDALSVFHLPSLAPFLADRSKISQKVLSPAEITEEQYDTMISVFLPLGRTV